MFFNYNKIKEINWKLQTIKLISNISEFKGRQELYLKNPTENLNKLIKNAKKNTIKVFLETNNFMILEKEYKKILNKNYHNLLVDVYKNFLNQNKFFKNTPLVSSEIVEIFNLLFKDKIKENNQRINPFALEALCDNLNVYCEDKNMEILILIANFLYDFISLNIFLDKTKFISALLTNILLLKNGYYIGKYISIETNILSNWKMLNYKNKSLTEIDNRILFINNLLNIINQCYLEFENKVKYFERKISISKKVEKIIAKKITKFTKGDILKLLPEVSNSSIQKILSKLVKANVIEKFPKGKYTFYIKINN
ncbi:hypothetical protein [Mesomycoplasma lagogenitalium]|uniref:Fido domain-containing protein n=1 Tax=Mesomycoplasma lagogenitalium TaxID=171286 RepID=A0ABY8LV60_9BACT|nr:hypothetical protein [Mesomycoplasma lagogenitalium]WGI36331.1 hypothetical protein QEG99_02530 [Mesomycoplasma lagogenitalium]